MLHVHVYCNFFSGECLKCKCDPCHQDAVNDTCIATGKCFTGIRATYENGYEEEYWTFGCLSDHEEGRDGNSLLQVSFVKC